MMRRLLLALLLPLLWTWAFVLFAYARYAAYARHKELPASSGSWLAAAWREVRCLLLTQAWQLRLPWAHRRWTVPGPERGRPVLCVHGFTQNGTNFVRIQRALWRAGRSSEAVLLGLPPQQIHRYAAVLEHRLDALVADARRRGGPDAGVDVVAHSMGGIVLRLVLARRPDLRPPLRRVVTLGSPHHGTAAARGMHLFPEVRFLARRNAELLALPHLPELLPHALVVNVGGTDDTTVYPVETTLEPGAEHVRLDGLGHAGILAHPTAVAAVMAALSRPLDAERAA